MFPVKLLFRSAIVLASLLLFLGEPIAAKQLLPFFGGSVAVWITCLVFFQLALLAGYLYAHALTRGPQTQSRLNLHLLLLAGAAVSAALWAAGREPRTWGAEHPVAGIFYSLTASIGLPFLLLASTSPLLQVWIARTTAGAVPFRLYGLSNLASLLALLAYPTVIEPDLTLRFQRVLWSAGVFLFAVLSAVLAWNVKHLPELESTPTHAPEPPTSRPTRLLWFLLPMVGAMQLSAVTQHLTLNVAAIPLLWILPLAVYLITFVLAFQSRRPLPRTLILGLLAVLLIALAQFLQHPEMAVPIALSIILFLAELFIACLFCHTELYRLRPLRSAEATLFYLLIAAGGATGAFLIGLAAPLLFSGNYDLSLTFALTAALALAVCWRHDLQQRLLWTACTALLLFLCLSLRTAYRRDTLLATRNFYGNLRVRRGITPDGYDLRTLMHGTIIHGSQIFAPGLMRTPTTYYAPDSGIGLALRLCCADRPRRIGVVGLGAGTLAAYGRPGDTIRFYEIDPAVQPIARNLFTYLRESSARIAFVTGDARASLAREIDLGQPQAFDVLVIDAFSGDAIPLHLLTLQALALYRRHLAPGGILAFHVSNQYVDLEPELAALAQASGLSTRSISSDGDDRRGELGATWILLTNNDRLFQTPELSTRAIPLSTRPNIHPWSDDYSSLLPLLRW